MKGDIDFLSETITQMEKLVFVTAPMVIAATNVDGKILGINPAVRTLFGYLEGELEGRDFSMLIPELETMEYDYFQEVEGRGDLELFTTNEDQSSQLSNHIEKNSYNYLERFMFGCTQHDKKEIRTKKKNGDALWVECFINKVNTKNHVIFIVVLHDITSNKLKEEKLTRSNEALAQRVEVRSKQLLASNKELDTTTSTLKNTQEGWIQSEKMAAMRTMVVGVAHEINTPLGVGYTATSTLEFKINEFTALWQQKKIKKSELDHFLTQLNHSSKIIISSLDRIGRLVKSFQRVVPDLEQQITTFKLRTYINFSLSALKTELAAGCHEVLVQCHDDLEIENYPWCIFQIVTHLVTNSISHGYQQKKGGRMRFDVTKHKGYYLIKYSDDGSGIKPEHIGRIFNPFFTLQKAQHAGLGLHIIYNIITDKLNGMINCTSIPDKETTFSIYLPVSIEQGLPE